MGSGIFLKLLIEVLAGPLVSLVYPLYASVQAIEKKSSADSLQLLIYWVLHSMITLFELNFAKLIAWFPMLWYYAKLIATCWLVLPYFNGAAYVYEKFVRPILMDPQRINLQRINLPWINLPRINLWNISGAKDIIGKRDDILTAAEKHIQKNGIEKLSSTGDREVSSRRSRSYKNFDDEDYRY